MLKSLDCTILSKTFCFFFLIWWKIWYKALHLVIYWTGCCKSVLQFEKLLFDNFCCCFKLTKHEFLVKTNVAVFCLLSVWISLIRPVEYPGVSFPAGSFVSWLSLPAGTKDSKVNVWHQFLISLILLQRVDIWKIILCTMAKTALSYVHLIKRYGALNFV